MRNRILSFLLLCFLFGIPYGIWYYYDASRVSWGFEYTPEGPVSVFMEGNLQSKDFPVITLIAHRLQSNFECTKSPCTLQGILPISQRITLKSPGKKPIIYEQDFSESPPQKVFRFEGALKITELSEKKESTKKLSQEEIDRCIVLSGGIQPRIFNSNGCIVVRTRGDTKYTELLYIHYADAQITTLISYPNSTDTFIQNSPSNQAIFTKEQNQNYITLLGDDGYIHEALPPHIESLDGYMLQEHIAMLLTPQGPGIWNITTGKFIPVFEFDSFGVGNTDIIGFVSGTTELQSFLYPNRKNILVKKSLFRGTRSVLGEWTYKDLPLKIIVSAHDTIAIETNNSFYSVE